MLDVEMATSSDEHGLMPESTGTILNQATTAVDTSNMSNQRMPPAEVVSAFDCIEHQDPDDFVYLERMLNGHFFQ